MKINNYHNLSILNLKKISYLHLSRDDYTVIDH